MVYPMVCESHSVSENFLIDIYCVIHTLTLAKRLQKKKPFIIIRYKHSTEYVSVH